MSGKNEWKNIKTALYDCRRGDNRTLLTVSTLTVSRVLMVITWVIAILSWVLNGEIPLELSELIRYAIILQCTLFACYCCKSGYETYCKYKFNHYLKGIGE